jgi:predicted TIM-barrel fold metal-dependent hydrolase
MVVSEYQRSEIETKTKRIDGDTHYTLTLDFKELRDLLPKSKMAEAQDMMWRDGERFANPNGVRADVGGRVDARGARPASTEGDPTRNPDARVEQIKKLGFDMGVLILNTAMPAPLRPADKPLYLRKALSQLYNNAAAELQATHPDRFICHSTIPWDDIEFSIQELQRVKKLGLNNVLIAGSYMNQNLDAYELYPFWEAVSDLDMTCFVHDTPQPCGGTILHHSTPYPMVGWERYERLHIGTYLGFGIDYTVAVASLSLGGVFDEFPNLRFMFMEGGALWMRYAMSGSDRSFFIEPACARTRNLPSDLIRAHCITEVQGLEPVEAVVAAFGNADNLFMSTDFPHPEFQALPNETDDITSANLSDEDKAKILGGNLARFLKVE